MKVKNDQRSQFSNLSNWKEEAWKKKSGLQQDSNPWPPPCRQGGGHGFESCWSPDFFFQASSFQLLKLENLLRWSFSTFNVLIANSETYGRYARYATIHFNTIREIFVNFLLLDWSIVFQQFWNCDVSLHASVNWLSLMSRIIQSSKYNTACPPYDATRVLLELACLLMSRIKKSLLYHSTKASRSSWTNPLDSRCHALIIFGWYDKT